MGDTAGVVSGVDLVGREAELSRLTEVLAVDGERAVVVSGEPGVGKTALLEQICAQAAAEGWRVVRVLGVAAEEKFALGGLNQLVIGLSEWQAGLTECDRAVLAPVVSAEAGSAVSGLPLAASVLRLLDLASQSRPVLLVVDDLHWLDSISAEVLGSVGRRLPPERVRILAARRVPYRSVFSATGWNELALAALDVADSERLLDRAGAVLPEVTRAAVLAVAAGNPLALAELPRFAGRIECGPAALALTDRLVAVFGGRAGQLDADARADLLRAALDGITAGTVASRSRFVIGDGESAVAAGLLVVDASGQYVFRHPLVRAAVVHQASPVQRRAAHRELAGLYPDVLVRRATHLAAAAVEPDQEVADLLEQAAQLSIRRGGLPVAVEWLRRAAELSTDSDRRTALLAEAVFVAARAGRPGEVTELVDSAETRGANSANAALFAAYRAFHADGEVISTHRRLIEVLAKSDTIDGKTVNRLANLLLSITNFAGDAEKRERTNVALAALGTRVAPTILMYRTGVDSIVNTTSGIRSLLATYAEFLPKLEPRMVMLLSFPAYCVDAMAQFRYPLEQAFTQLSEHGASIDAIEGGRVLLLDMMAGGHWDRAEKVGAQCLEMAGEVQGSELVRHQLLGDLGVFAAWRGDLETARRNAADVTAWAAPRGLHLLVGVAQRIAVRVALAEADYETAYQAAIGISAPGHFPRQNIQVGDDMLDLVEALINTGRVEEARAHVAEAVRLNLAEVSPRVAALTTAITAMTAPDSDAEGLYQSALGHPGIADFPFEHARIALAHGMWLRRQLRHTAARGALGLAAETFDRLGARPWADRAGAELRAAGASVSRSSGEPATLSTQERRIADLAADGKSNKEIAAALSLAPRTVESHLHRVFRKLGITRRSALNKALREHA